MEGITAIILIKFSGASFFALSVLAAAVLAGIYILVRKRSLSSRIGIFASSGVCLLALLWAIAVVHKRPSVAPSHGILAPSNGAMVSHAAAPNITNVAASSRSLGTPRAVYGHSIIKGGIHSLGELLDVIATDPVAAQHYKGFDITRARFFRLDHNIMAYVSYRVDGKGIYWTSKPVLIMAGEEVITDGTNFIRVRCGNMIAFASQLPMETESATDTDTIVETLPAIPAPFLTASLESAPSIPGAENTPAETPANCCSGGGYFPPPIFEQPRPPTTTPVIPPSMINVDEFPRHGAFFCIFATILLLFLVERFRR